MFDLDKHMSVQHNVEKLGHLSRKQILVNFCDYFGDEVIVLSVEGCDTIVGFRTFVTKSL